MSPFEEAIYNHEIIGDDGGIRDYILYIPEQDANLTSIEKKAVELANARYRPTLIPLYATNQVKCIPPTALDSQKPYIMPHMTPGELLSIVAKRSDVETKHSTEVLTTSRAFRHAQQQTYNNLLKTCTISDDTTPGRVHFVWKERRGSESVNEFRAYLKAVKGISSEDSVDSNTQCIVGFSIGLDKLVILEKAFPSVFACRTP